MIHACRKSRPYGPRCLVRGLHPVSSSYKPISYPRTDREMSPTPALYNSVELCKPFRYLECKRNKWNCEEGGGGGRLQRRKVRIACFEGDEIAGVQEMERAKKLVAILLNDVWHTAMIDVHQNKVWKLDVGTKEDEV